MRKTEQSKRDKWLSLLFFLYLLFIIKMIVFKYPVSQMRAIVDSWQRDVILEGLSTANFIPFKTIKMYIRYYDLPGIRSFANLFGNVLIFVPVGMLFPFVHERGKNIWILLTNAFLFVAGIEIFQLFSAFGAFDVDDIILNCFGVLMGRVLFEFLFGKRENLP